jgi:hypothetical protein
MPHPFCVIFTQSSGLFLFSLPFAILPELPASWCITYPTRTRHSAGNRRHPGSSVEQNDSWRIFPQNEVVPVRFPHRLNLRFRHAECNGFFMATFLQITEVALFVFQTK